MKDPRQGESFVTLHKVSHHCDLSQAGTLHLSGKLSHSSHVWDLLQRDVTKYWCYTLKSPMARIEEKEKSEKPTNNADAMTRPTRWGLAWGVLRANLSLSTQEYNPMPLLCRPVISRTDSYEPTIAAIPIPMQSWSCPSIISPKNSHLLCVCKGVFLLFLVLSAKKNPFSFLCLYKRRDACGVLFVLETSGRDAHGILFLLESLVQHGSSSRSSSNKHACKTDSPPSIMPDPFANAVRKKKGKVIFTKHR